MQCDEIDFVLLVHPKRTYTIATVLIVWYICGNCRIKMTTLNDLVLQLNTNDTKKKLGVGQEIIDYLGKPDNPVECEDLGGFIDTLVPFMQSSNFKVGFPAQK